MGSLGLAYGGFSYTKEEHRANIGSLHLSLDEKGYINIPVWAGIIFIIVGGLLLIKRIKD